jgi:mannitol 2-dehydrogenase
MTFRRLNADLVAALRTDTSSRTVLPSPRPAGRIVTPRGIEGFQIVHFGVGAFHRSHLAVYLDDLDQLSKTPRWSIIGTGVTTNDVRMADALEPQDGYYTLVEKSGTQTVGRIIGSLTEFRRVQPDARAVIQALVDPATKIVSMTITEGGYPIRLGVFDADDTVLNDLTSEVPSTTFGVIVAALDQRRRAGLAPFTVLSCDNLPGNGAVARTAVLGAASARSDALGTWLETNGAFPNSMVDRITPATTDADRAFVQQEYGFYDAWPVVCEPFRQWALEDTFVDGRPRFEEVGVLMTSDVIPYEHMKLRLLNGSHSALAYHAALAGIGFVHEAMNDPTIEAYVRQLMALEAAPTLETPAGIDLVSYQNELVTRFSNPAIADTIARLCLDGSAKFPTFILQTLDHQLRHDGPIELLTLALAGWCKYLRGWADDGTSIELSSDPHLAEAVKFAQASVGDARRFLGFERVFGPHLGQTERFAACFAAAMHSLETIGSLATLREWTTTSGPRQRKTVAS